jgi:hypothetical protein
MSVVTNSAYEPAAEAFAGFCGSELQRRELCRRQLLAAHKKQQPDAQTDACGEEDDTAHAVTPAVSSRLPSQSPAAAAAFCDFKEADAVQLERCISSIDASSENGKCLLMQSISAACSKIIRIPAENVVEGAFALECACLFVPALDSSMSPDQRQWFPQIANKRIVQLLLDVARSSETDDARALACSSLEHISYFESGRYIVTSEDVVPILLHLANHVREETAVVSLIRIFPAFCRGVRTQAAQHAFVSLGCSVLQYGRQHVELYFVAFRQLKYLTPTECDTINHEKREKMRKIAAVFLMCESLASVLIRAAQLENLSSRALNSLCAAFLEFTETKKGTRLLSNDTVVSIILRMLMKVDDFDVNCNMTCNLARILLQMPVSRHSEVLQAMIHCSVAAPYHKHPEEGARSNYFNTNILLILRMIAADFFDPNLHVDDPIDSFKDLEQSLLSIFKPFAITMLRLAASTDDWAAIQNQGMQDGFTVYDKHHALNCKMAVLHTASNIISCFHQQLCVHRSSESACAHLLKMQFSADDIGSSNSKFHSIESLLLSSLLHANTLFRDQDVRLLDDHVKGDKLGLHLFRLLRWRSILYFNDDAKLESNNRLIFTALSNLQYPNDSPSPQVAIDVDCILETAFSSKKFEDFFERYVSSVTCENFHTISRLFLFLSQKCKVLQTERAVEDCKKPWRLEKQCSVFKSLIDVLISTYSDTGHLRMQVCETGTQLPANCGSQASFSRVRVVNWDDSVVVVSFNHDATLSDLATSACEAFHHQPGAFDVVCAHSRAVFAPSEIGVLLSEMGLVPSGKVHLQERKSAHLAEITIVDLKGNETVVQFEAAATLNDIAYFVIDRQALFRHKGFPKKSFSIVVNGKTVFPESSFASVSLFKAGLLPSGSISFQDLKECCIGAECEASILHFLCFANNIIYADSPLFNSDTARLLISLLQCSLCYHAQAKIMDFLTTLLPTCNPDLISNIRHILFQRVDQLSQVNIRCQCEDSAIYNDFFHRIKDAYGKNLLKSLLKLHALPNAIAKADFFEMVDRIVVSRTHLHRRTLWIHRDSDRSMSLTNALAELFPEKVQDLIEFLCQTSPQSPLFLRYLCKIMTVILNTCQDKKRAGLSPDLIRLYLSAIRNVRDAALPWCTDAALISAFIFNMHVEKENTSCCLSGKCIKTDRWNALKEHFCIVCDIYSMSGTVLPPMLRIFSSFLEASCEWYGPGNVMQKRNLNSEFGESRLNSLVSAALEMSSHSNYLFMDSAARLFKAMASNAQLSQRLTVAVADAILLMLGNYQTFCVKHLALTSDDDESNLQHVLEALHAIVTLSHLEAAVLKPSTLEILSRFHSHREVMDILLKIQAISIGQTMIASSPHTVAAILNALKRGTGDVQSKAIKILANGLQSPQCFVWRRAPGLKDALDHLLSLASIFYFVDGNKKIADKPFYDQSHILFSSHQDLILLLESLICCCSTTLNVSGSHVKMASEPVFDIRDLLAFTFDLLRYCDAITFDLGSCDAECVSSCSLMHSLIRVLKATPPSLVSEHILKQFDDAPLSVPTWLFCALNAMADDPSCIQLLCSHKMIACFLNVGRNPVSACLELALTQEANENFMHQESLRPEFDWDFIEQPKKRPRKSHKEHLKECLKFDALKQQRLKGLAHSCSLYQLIYKVARHSQDGVVMNEELLCMLLDAVRPGTNLRAVSDIVVAVCQIFGQRSRAETHAAFNVATFSKMRQFLFVALGHLQTASVRVDASHYSKEVKEDLWSDIFRVLGNYMYLLLQIYPFRSFRRALAVKDERLGGKSIIDAIIHIITRGTKTSPFAFALQNPFDLFSRMLLSPLRRDAIALHFPEIVKFVIDDQKLHQQKLFEEKHRLASFGLAVEYYHCKSDVYYTMISFLSKFARLFPRIASEQFSQISSVGVFACRMATYVEPRIIQEACSFVSELLHNPLSNVVYATFASALFADLAAMCDFAMIPSQQDTEEPSLFKKIGYDDKLAIVNLIEEVASFGPLIGDNITLALLRLTWGSFSYEEMHGIAPCAQALLSGMGVTKDNFFQALPKYWKPIAADAGCYMEDLCCADEGEEIFQVSR